MLDAFLNAIAQNSVPRLAERLDEFRLAIEFNDVSPQEVLHNSLDLLALTKRVPERDLFELRVEFDGGAVVVTDQKVGEETIREHLGNYDEIGTAEVELIVRKSRGSTVTIYSLKSFAHYLHSESLLGVLRAMDARFEGHLVFECISPIAESGSATIRFIPCGHALKSKLPDNASTERSQIIEAFRDNSYNTGIDTKLIPSDFYICDKINVPEVTASFNRICAVLSAVYLSSGTTVEPHECLNYKIVGYKSIEGRVAFSELAPALNALYKIYSWAYAEGGSADRIGLARNVISLHVNRLQDISNSPTLWNTIYSNYQIYLKSNVASYLEVKNRISEFLIQSSAKTQALVDSLVDSFKNSVFAILTFLITVVVVHGLKASGVSVIFSSAYLLIVLSICLLLTVWVIGAAVGAVKRFDNMADTMSEVLTLGYSSLLSEDELNRSVTPIRLRNRNYLIGQCWSYGVRWCLIVLILLATFATGNYMLGSDLSTHDEEVDAVEMEGVGLKLN